MRTRRAVAVVAIAAAALLLLVALPEGAAATGGVAVTIRVDRPVAHVNRRLVGFDWHPGPVPLSAVAALHPAVVRLDASLERISPAPGRLDLAGLLDEVAQIRAIGAEPVVILSYTPRWLARTPALLGDPTRSPPRDLTTWQRLVHDVVRALATSPAPARWFEAWNEPELPTFWAGLPTEWLDLAAASARAVHQVAAETGVDLTFGGPASVIPDPVLLAGLEVRLAAQGTPLDFASWHHYGNLPCLGPDGPEPGLPGGEVQTVLGCRNPLARPSAFGAGVELQRAASGRAAPARRKRPTLAIDEWNLSSGGLDRRHDTVAGAAFDAATLVQLQDHGLDWAAFYKATDNSPGPGDLGLVHLDGGRKPAWWTFWLWQQLAAVQLATTTRGIGPAPAVLASRSADGRRLTTLLASFTPSCQGSTDVALHLVGGHPSTHAMLRFVPGDGRAPVGRTVRLRAGRLRLRMTGCAVAMVETGTD